MSQRKKVPDSTQADVLVKSRRRCCICYGLERDESRKKGQVAHLDGDRNNNEENNLAFLCLDHHDEYDSKTSQTKGLQRKEIEAYRDELYQLFSVWSGQFKYKELLNFMAFNADIRSLAAAAIKAASGSTCYGVELAFEVLITDEARYSDADLYIPYLSTLDYLASWGLLTYSETELVENNMPVVSIEVVRKEICNDIAKEIITILEEKGEDIRSLTHIAEYRCWSTSND